MSHTANETPDRIPVHISEDPVFLANCQTLDSFKPDERWTNVAGCCQVKLTVDRKFHVHVMGMLGYVVFEHPDHAAIYITGIVRGLRLR